MKTKVEESDLFSEINCNSIYNVLRINKMMINSLDCHCKKILEFLNGSAGNFSGVIVEF